ncbi:putative toxin-antitoxin system toxin component, PIN family [Candidatus Fermentibacteria bacterium]|nr:putative toxin-antitoxin system toxin component, PIN family [Candidatus Fermentibacteria bacterium]
MKAVLDTNVLVSGMINPVGAPGRLVDMVRAGVLRLVVDDRVPREYADVLRRPMLRSYFSLADAEAILDFLRHGAEPALATVCVSGLPDPDDAPFLEVALASGVPLITGNTRHFPLNRRAGCTVLTAAEFVAQYCQADATPVP